jgi:predicted Fe-Mo cluster-binding NifX family protein
MKIAVTAHGTDKNATIDTRFGRADYFLIYDQEKDMWESVPNTQNLEAAHGAGIQAGQTLIQTGAKVLITGHVGPKAFKVLSTGQIDMYAVENSDCTVKEALDAYLSGTLTAIDNPNR